VGSQVGDGSDRVVAIVVGTVIGAAIGREIGRELDDRDRACIGHALELAKDGQSVRWVNENDGLSYIVTPTPADGSSTCRDFDLVISAESGTQSARRHAFRTADGTWQMSLNPARRRHGRSGVPARCAPTRRCAGLNRSLRSITTNGRLVTEISRVAD
jgi:surface antigen